MNYKSDDLYELQVNNSYLWDTDMNVLWSCRVCSIDMYSKITLRQKALVALNNNKQNDLDW